MEESDRQILSFVGAHRFVLVAHVQQLLQSDESVVLDHLGVLEANGLVRRERVLCGGESLFRITGSGLAAIGSRLWAPGFELAALRHEVGVVWLWLAASQGRLGPADRVLSEREMEGLDRAARRVAGVDRPAPFGTYMAETGGSSSAGLRYPDVMLVTIAGRVAVHLQLRPPPRPALEQLLLGYAAERRITVALFMVDDPTVGRAVETTAEPLGLPYRVMVQRAVIPPREPASHAVADTSSSV